MATGNFACSQCKSTTEPTSTCIQCNNLSFCDGCWPKWILHGRGSVGYDGKPHEKSNPHVVQQVRGILEPQNAERTLEEQLQQDEHTTWFGIERHQPEQVTLEDYGRFATLMSESKFEGENDGDRFPQLVSFIGQCGNDILESVRKTAIILNSSRCGKEYYHQAACRARCNGGNISFARPSIIRQ